MMVALKSHIVVVAVELQKYRKGRKRRGMRSNSSPVATLQQPQPWKLQCVWNHSRRKKAPQYLSHIKREEKGIINR